MLQVMLFRHHKKYQIVAHFNDIWNSESKNISYNNFDLSYNLQSNGIPNTMNDTKKYWPNGTGTGGTNSNSGIPSASNDYLKQISLLADPAALRPEIIQNIFIQ